MAARGRAGGALAEGPTRQPWGATEVHLADPDGNRWVFLVTPEPPPRSDFDASMEQVAARLRDQEA